MSSSADAVQPELDVLEGPRPDEPGTADAEVRDEARSVRPAADETQSDSLETDEAADKQRHALIPPQTRADGRSSAAPPSDIARPTGRRTGSGQSVGGWPRLTASRRAKSATAAAVLGMAILLIGCTVILNAVSGGSAAVVSASAWIQLTLAPSRPIDSTELQVAASLINQRVHAAGVSSVDVESSGDDLVISVPRSAEAVTEFLAQSDQLEVRTILASSGGAGASAAASATAHSSASGAKTEPTARQDAQQRKAASKKASKATPKTQSWAPVYSASQAAATAAVARLDCSAAARGAAPQPVAADYLTTCDPATDAAVVLSPAVLVSTDIASAGAASSTAGWSVDLGLDQAGTAAFSALTQHLAASHGRFAFVVDGVVLDSRNPTTTVTDGAAQFGGALTELQAKALADALTTGPLPVSFDAISVQGISIDNVPASS